MSPVPRPSFTALLPSVLSREHTIVTEGGLETQLIFLKALELPNFCAFEAVLCESWRPVLKDVLTVCIDPPVCRKRMPVRPVDFFLSRSRPPGLLFAWTDLSGMGG
mmetsp:Transcript_7743/g.22047  ORF Transcript_7743/g.22047 Transcript_7743/m.22047 type:complete len:106 (-) Transcript_7743:1115-1432(-)